MFIAPQPKVHALRQERHVTLHSYMECKNLSVDGYKHRAPTEHNPD